MADLEYHQAQEVPPPESSTISTTSRRTLLATPSREEIDASGGLMEVGLERFQADQGKLLPGGGKTCGGATVSIVGRTTLLLGRHVCSVEPPDTTPCTTWSGG